MTVDRSSRPARLDALFVEAHVGMARVAPFVPLLAAGVLALLLTGTRPTGAAALAGPPGPPGVVPIAATEPPGGDPAGAVDPAAATPPAPSPSPSPPPATMPGSAVAAIDCIRGGVTLLLANPGGNRETAFTVARVAHEVAAGDSLAVNVPVAEDAAYGIAVTGPGGLSQTFAGGRHCAESPPLVTAAINCIAGGVTLLLGNPAGNRETRFTVDGVGVVVAAGATEVVEVPVAEDAAYAIVASGPGGFSRTFAGERRCTEDPAAAAAAVDCAQGGVVVTLSNPAGNRETAFAVAGVAHTVAAGGALAVAVPVAEDAAYDVAVTGPGGYGATFVGARHCEDGPVSVSAILACDEGALLVILTNPAGNRETAFAVAGDPVPVAAGTSVTAGVPVAEDAAYEVAVAGPGGFSRTFAGERHCTEAPAGASVAVDCALSGLVVGLTNPAGNQETDFLLDGAPVSIPGGAGMTMTMPLGEDAAYDLAISGPGGYGETFAGVRDCVRAETELPAVPTTACAGGGIAVTVANPAGNTGTAFVVGSVPVEVPAGERRAVTVPVEDGAPYTIVVMDPTGAIETLAGTRDCAGAPTPVPPGTATGPNPPDGGTTSAPDGSETPDADDLPETGTGVGFGPGGAWGPGAIVLLLGAGLVAAAVVFRKRLA